MCLKFKYLLFSNFVLQISLASILYWLSVLNGFSQQNQSYDLFKKLSDSYLCASNEQERLFVSLSSSFYYPGESIYFKTILYGSNMKIKTDGSSFFYIQLMNKTGEKIGNYLFKLENGECSGKIKIADTLPSGIYKFKVYTKWMKNYGLDNNFERPFLVISYQNNSGGIIANSDSMPVHFYPEGGILVAGLMNKMLLKVNSFLTDKYSLVAIVDEQGDTVQKSGIDPDGYGLLNIKPGLHKSYFAVLNGTDNKKLKVKLPVIQNLNYKMSVSVDSAYVKVNIISTFQNDFDQPIYFSVLSGECQFSFQKNIELQSGQCFLSINKKAFAKGINQLLLMNDDSILCTRVIYIKPTVQNEPEVILKDTLTTREEAIVNINYSLSKPENAQKNLIVSINEYTDYIENKLFDELNYYNYLDLYSSVNNPGELPFFSISENEKHINECLLACPRTNIFQYIFDSKKLIKYRREKEGITLSGRIISNLTNSPIADACVLLSYPDTIAHIDYAFTNSEGEFCFNLNEKLCNRQIFLVVKDYPRKNNLIRIEIDDKFESIQCNISHIKYNENEFSGIIETHKNIALTYKVFSKKLENNEISNSLMPQVSSKEHFYGKADQIIIPAEYDYLPDIYEINRNLIFGVRLDSTNGFYSIRLYDPITKIHSPNQALLLLNNIPYPSLKNISSLNTLFIRKIEIKNPTLYYDNFDINGIMAIYTKTLSKVEPYYSYCVTEIPLMYGDKIKINDTLLENTTYPDLRHNIYWNPNLKELQAKLQINFKTSDIKGKYWLKVLAISNDQELGTFRKILFIK